MPNALVKSLAKKSGKSIKDVEKAWNKAKVIAIQTGKDEDDYDFFALVTGITKKMIKVEGVVVLGVKNA